MTNLKLQHEPKYHLSEILTGWAALREAGLIPTLIPLLKDMDSEHTCLVSAAVHILEAFMDYSNTFLLILLIIVFLYGK